MPNSEGLVRILLEVRGWLGREDNDFTWSSWENASEALAELDALIAHLRSGSMPSRLDLEALFAPTGPIQEVSLSSGWGEAFLSLASRFEAEFARLTQNGFGR